VEVIVADDGSTDGTGDVVAATDPAARYLWAPNTGSPSAPRNRGFAACRGRYVAFLDADDEWLPGAAARAIGLLERHPQVDLLFGDAKYGNAHDGFVSWIELAGEEAFRKLPRRELEPGFALLKRGPLFRHMTARNAVFLGACFVRREVFATIGGFDTAYWGGEDWEVWMRLAAVRNLGFLNEPLAIYTRHAGNVTNNRDRMTGGFCQALRNVLERCDLSSTDRRCVRNRLRRQLFSYAYLAYDRGDLTVARQRFREAVRAGNRRPLTLALTAACHLPSWLTGTLRGWKQRVTGG
jgi:glycosyltransferase involved in cell wall biosynthesis